MTVKVQVQAQAWATNVVEGSSIAGILLRKKSKRATRIADHLP
jgi:hypothetical protein